MRKALSIFLILCFVSAWFVPIATGGTATHICELTKSICKNKVHCPLKRGSHGKDSSHHSGCYIAIYKAGDEPNATVGYEHLQLCSGLIVAIALPDGLWQLHQQPLVVEDVSHTPPERPPQTIG